MKAPLILLHEEALRITHPMFAVAPLSTKAIYVWDDAYWKQVQYSLKRLVFIYETLCAMPIEIIHGNTRDVVDELSPSILYVPATNNPYILAIHHDLQAHVTLELVEDEPFAMINHSKNFLRFFQYWKQAKETVFIRNGGQDA